MRDGIEGFSALHRRRIVPTAAGSKERVALGVEPGEFLRAGKVGEMIAALAILSFVINDFVNNLDLVGAEVALKIGGVVLRVPQAEFNAGKNGEPGRLPAAVGH